MKLDQMSGPLLTSVSMLGDTEDQKTHHKFMTTLGKRSLPNKRKEEDWNMKKEKELRQQN